MDLSSIPAEVPSDADPARLSPAMARGRRPEFTDDPMLDRLYSVTLALVSELAVTRARLDALERVLARGGTLAPGAIDAFRPDPADAEARSLLQAEYLERVFRELAPSSPPGGRR